MNHSPASVLAPNPADASPPSDELLLASIVRQADFHFGREEWLAARVCLEQGVAIAPNNPQLLDALGSIQYRLNDFATACATFTKAVQKFPDNPDLHIQLAMVHMKLGQNDQAKLSLARSLALRPKNPLAREMLGNLDFAAKRWADAAEQYCAAMEGNPDGISLLLHLGKCQHELHDLGSAKWCFERVLTLDSSNEVALDAMRILSPKGGAAPTADRAETGCGCASNSSEKSSSCSSVAAPEDKSSGCCSSTQKAKSSGTSSPSEEKTCGCSSTAKVIPEPTAVANPTVKETKALTTLNRAPAAEAPVETKVEASIMVEPQYHQEHEELLSRAYAEARRPYLETISPIPAHAFTLPSWRYFVEINSGCNLRCTMCIRGDSKGYGHKNGFMNQDMFEKILDKISTENSKADICLYGNSEPFLHPRLHECIAHVKKRGLTCLVSTNLNIVKNLKEVLEAKPDAFIISLSGFTQDVYVRAHVGGDIELVKENMKLVAATRASLGSTVPVLVHYHLYQDNWGEEYDKMKAFATELGFTITVSWARSISMEKTIQYLRYKEKKTKGAVPPLKVSPAGYGGKEALISLFPEVTETFLKDIDRLGITPDEASDIYKKYPEPTVCPVGDMFTYIRYDGSVSLCSCVSDTRLTVASNFLEVTQEQLHRRRRFNPLCRECLRYKMHMYYHIVDIPMWDKTMAQKFPTIPTDRRKF